MEFLPKNDIASKQEVVLKQNREKRGDENVIEEKMIFNLIKKQLVKNKKTSRNKHIL
jgi:hypothetical protein